MTRPPVEIQSKARFLLMLDDAKRRTDEILAGYPERPLMMIIKAQLEFMAECTKGGGRDPTEEEAAKISIGPIAVKNLEEEDPEFADWLSELDYAFCDTWKTLP